MGTTLTKEEKIQQLRGLVEQWLRHLTLYKDVTVREFTKTSLLTSKPIRKNTPYGEEDTQLVEIIKIPPTSYIEIMYHTPTQAWMDKNGYESTQFPFDEIDKRIEHYKYKLKSIIKNT